ASLVIFSLRIGASKVIALVAAAANLFVSLVVFASFERTDAVQFVFEKVWISSLGINFNLGIDGISLLLILLTTVMVPFIILSSFGNHYDKPWTFYGLVLLMQSALRGVFTARDGFLFYLFWEMALIPIYFICLIWGGENRARITLKFFIYTLAGSLLMLVALIYVYYQTPGVHSFGIAALYEAGQKLSVTEQGFVFWGLFIAFAVKMPVFPFHTWQPDTYTVAPVQGTMLLSAIMLKMGLFGLIRWLLPVVPAGVQEWGMVAVVLSVIGIVYASCIAMVQKDFKRLIAYSSIAHVGLISAGILTATQDGLQGALIQMLSHGILVFGLFFVVELIGDRTDTRNIAELGGIRNEAPVFTTVFVVLMLGSVALPMTSGFVGEFLLIKSVFQYEAWIGAMAGLTIILGAVYMLRSYQGAMSGETVPATQNFADLKTLEKFVLYPIVILVILIGVYPSPLMEISEASVAKLVNDLSTFTATAAGK
ncbi:MAG TPA: NADH-quinone oxidoreductase subunit M, partial [Sphingobacteriaceae bacterium]